MIINNHYRTITFSVYFSERKNNDTRMYRFLLPQILLKTNDEFKTEKLFRKQLQEFYDASFNVNSLEIKDNHILIINFTFIHLRFVDDESFFDDIFNFYFKTLFNRSSLSKEHFEIEKRKSIELFETIKDNKNLYARERFLNEFYSNNLNYLEKLEQLKNMSYEDLYNYYNEIFENNIIDYYISGNLTKEMTEVFTNKFKNSSRNLDLTPNYLPFRTRRDISETLKTEQTLLYLGFSITPFTKSYNYEAELLTDYIIGGFSESRLFKVIREEMGLCYSVRSTIDVNNGTLIIHAGVNHNNKTKALDAIINLIEDLKINGITDEELEIAKKYYISALKESKDNQLDMINFHYLNKKLNRSNDFNNKFVLINAVTKEDIIKVINNLVLDTTYVLEADIEKDKGN